MFKAYRILVIEDDESGQQKLKNLLSESHYQVFIAKNGVEALGQLKHSTMDMIISNMHLPDINGIELFKHIKKLFPPMNYIFLSGLENELDIVLAFELGADDYMTKPYQPRVLLARIKKALKSRAPIVPASNTSYSLIFGDLNISLLSREVTLKENALALTKKEFDLLVLLSSRRPKVFSREEILNSIWPNEFDVNDRVVDLHIGHLRNKIPRQLIKTVRGVGYQFMAPSPQ